MKFENIVMDNLEFQPRREQFDPEAQLIYQRGFGLVKKGKLGTAGLGPCIAWVGYNHEKNLLLVAHIDGMTDLPGSVSTIVSWLQYAGITNMRDVKSTLMGGDPTSQQLRRELLDLMHQFGFKNLEDLNPESKPDAGPRRFVVDASDGKIKQNVRPSKPEDPDLRTAKLARTQSLIKMTLQPEITEL
jgi:hypothetical protein